jgi:hypothetical protein
MNIKEKAVRYWYISLPATLLVILCIYYLGYHFGQWCYDKMH